MGELARRTPASLSKLIDKIEEFINVEETMKALMQSRHASEVESRGKQKDFPEEGRKAPNRVAKKMEIVAFLRMVAPQGKPIYNRLNINMAHILIEIQEDSKLNWPPKMLTLANRRSQNR
jgi:hypothetical protein